MTTDDVMTPLPKGTRILGAERKALATDLARRYRAGDSLDDLVALTGRSYGFVHQLLAEAGVEMRPRGGTRRRTRKAAAK